MADNNKEEEAYKKELADLGLEVEGAETEEPENPEPTPAPTPEKKPTPESEETEEPETPDDKPKVDDDEGKNLPEEPKVKVARKLSDKYKEKKADLRAEKELREQAEKDRDELLQRIKDLEEGKTPTEQKDAIDDIEAFAEETGMDADAIKKMKALILKDVVPTGLDPETKAMIEDLQKFKEQHSDVILKQEFEKEFKAELPKIKALFPNSTEESMEAIKEKLDELSHSEGWNDKDLEYIAFKNQKTLSALVSPVKRGIESKGKVTIDKVKKDFDPNADVASMGDKASEEWLSEYDKATKDDGNRLNEDRHGNLRLI